MKKIGLSQKLEIIYKIKSNDFFLSIIFDQSITVCYESPCMYMSSEIQISKFKPRLVKVSDGQNFSKSSLNDEAVISSSLLTYPNQPSRLLLLLLTPRAPTILVSGDKSMHHASGCAFLNSEDLLHKSFSL